MQYIQYITYKNIRSTYVTFSSGLPIAFSADSPELVDCIGQHLKRGAITLEVVVAAHWRREHSESKKTITMHTNTLVNMNEFRNTDIAVQITMCRNIHAFWYRCGRL